MPTHRHPHRERNQLNQSWTCPQTVLTNRQPNTMKRQLQFETHCMHRIWENTLNKITCNAFHVLPAPPGTSYKRPWEVGGGRAKNPNHEQTKANRSANALHEFLWANPYELQNSKMPNKHFGARSPKQTKPPMTIGGDNCYVFGIVLFVRLCVVRNLFVCLFVIVV